MLERRCGEGPHRLSSNHTISASFAANAAGTFSITPSAGSGGSISPATQQMVAAGGIATFTITPSSGYHVANVLVDGVSVGPVTGYTFSGVGANHTIAAAFAANSVRTRTTIKRSASSVKRGRTIKFSGVCTPSARTHGGKVKVYVKRPGSGTWQALSTYRAARSH